MLSQDELRRNALRCFMRFIDRAERINAQHLVETFVSAGPLADVLESPNHQIIFGRRGTGKTHALQYFFQKKAAERDIPVYIDCQNIGSNQSIYDDRTLSLEERGTRLLIDVISSLHFQLLNLFSDPKQDWDLSVIAPRLDALVDSISELRVHGPVEHEQRESAQRDSSENTSLSLTISREPAVGANYGASAIQSRGSEHRRTERGVEHSWIDFGFLGQRLRHIADVAPDRRIWILIDEWSTIPVDIQPYLADLLRRTLFNIPSVSGKIAAIEHRSYFKLDRESGVA